MSNNPYNDPDFMILAPGQCAYNFFCNTCGRHYQWEEEYKLCQQKHNRTRRSHRVLTGDD